jgi:predicted membrane protein
MLKNLEILPYFIIDNFFNWKTLLILIGSVFLITERKKLTGIILITIGTFFLLPNLLHFPFNFHHLFWPALFIIIGIYIIFSRRGGNYITDYENDGDDVINGTAFFGGGKKKIVTPTFKGGNLTAVFGGFDIDFTDAELSDGINVLNVMILFGGLKLIVPSDWKIDTNADVVLGGINDKRFSQTIQVMPGKTLVIEGFIMFGGCDVIGAFQRNRKY